MTDNVLAFMIAFFGGAFFVSVSPEIAGFPAIVLIGVLWWLVFQFIKRAKS